MYPQNRALSNQFVIIPPHNKFVSLDIAEKIGESKDNCKNQPNQILLSQ